MKHRRFTVFLAGLLAALFLLPGPAFAAELADSPPSTVSSTYVVMDADTGQVLIQKGMHERKYPASITKILTAALALEVLELDDRYIFTEEALDIDWSGTHLAMQVGEELSVRDLLYGMMLASANDVANGLGEAAAGSMSAFVDRMNARAAELGCENSHFANPSGYHDDTMFTTAYDMALITKWALTVEGFLEVFSAWDYIIEPTNLQPERRYLGTFHSMIVGPENNSSFGYEGAVGGKLGWTPEATHTMVTCAERNGMKLICVVMESTNQYEKFRDTIALYDYCFNYFVPTEIPLTDIEPRTLDLMEGGEKVAEALVSAPEAATVLIHRSCADVGWDITCTIPQQVTAEELEGLHYAITLRQQVSQMERELIVAPLLWERQELVQETLQQEDEGHKLPPGIWWEPLLWTMLALSILAMGAAVVLLIRRHNLRKYARQWERQRRMRELQRRSRNNRL